MGGFLFYKASSSCRSRHFHDCICSFAHVLSTGFILIAGCSGVTSLFMPFNLFFLFAKIVFWGFMLPLFPLNALSDVVH